MIESTLANLKVMLVLWVIKISLLELIFILLLLFSWTFVFASVDGVWSLMTRFGWVHR